MLIKHVLYNRSIMDYKFLPHSVNVRLQDKISQFLSCND